MASRTPSSWQDAGQPGRSGSEHIKPEHTTEQNTLATCQVSQSFWERKRAQSGQSFWGGSPWVAPRQALVGRGERPEAPLGERSILPQRVVTRPLELSGLRGLNVSVLRDYK